MFAGYWNQPAETAAMLSDGWLHTGDVAVMDADGFVTIVDRKRDVILASGFSIFPSEIEDVLDEHPAVAASAVVGVPHFYRGETVKAYVVLADGQSATEDELRAYCAYKLVAYKVPTLFEFRDDLPTNIIGKVLRRALREQHETAHAEVLAQRPVGSGNGVGEVTVATTAEPELTEPELAEPELTEPELTEPELAEPELTEPELTEPELAEPDPTGAALIASLAKLAELRDIGALTDEEFTAAKARLLR